MSLIKPFAGLRPAPGRAADVAAPPYDVLNSAEAAERATGKPWSFLHVSKSEIDLPAGTDPYAPMVYARAAHNLAAMRAQGVLLVDPSARYYAYRITMQQHIQTGLVAAASVRAYDAGGIKRHELTRPDKEDDRVRNMRALGAQTGPVLLAYPAAPAVDALLRAACEGPADADVTASDAVRHQIWPIADDLPVRALTDAFEAMPALYIADGHHRSAAASRVAAERRAVGGTSDAAHEYFLAVAFPHHELQILPYNRVVADLQGMTPATFLDRIRQCCSVAASDTPVCPQRAGNFGLFLAGQWYTLAIDPARVPSQDPVARLDVSLLADNILRPMLGISDPRRDPRIDFIGGIRGVAELERRVNDGKMAAAFSMHATSLDDLMAVADSGQIMPPKSTWFEPKLADGLVSHMID